MLTKPRKTIISTVLSIIITTLTVGIIVFAAPWADPTAMPPGNNAPEPVNVSNTGQAKSGGLILNTGGAGIGLLLQNGSMGIGDMTPDTGLKLDVEGKIGATEYCDQNGNNCSPATGGGSGSYTRVSVSGNVRSTLYATCPVGSNVVGGGFTTPYNTYAYESYASSDTQWRCTTYDLGCSVWGDCRTYTYTCYAVCAR